MLDIAPGEPKSSPQLPPPHRVLGALEAMATLYGDLEVCADAVAFRWQ